MRLGSHSAGAADRMSILWTCVYWDGILRTAGVLLCLVWQAGMDTFRKPDNLFCREKFAFLLRDQELLKAAAACRAPRVWDVDYRGSKGHKAFSCDQWKNICPSHFYLKNFTLCAASIHGMKSVLKPWLTGLHMYILFYFYIFVSNILSIYLFI